MASTIAIAASFQIDPEKLEAWAKGDKPTDEKELKICNEIFNQLQFVDGKWSPIRTTAKNTKTTKAKGKKKGTKKAASTDSVAASNKYNTESIVSEKASEVEVSSDLPEKAGVAQSDKTNSDLTQDKEAEDSSEKIFFTAVGMIRGEIKFDEVENQHTIKFSGKTYRLFYARKNYQAFTGLKKEIETSGNSTQRLIVYPKFTHFPQKEQPPRVGFQLIGFDKGAQPEGIGSQLKDNEFKLCGIWQFIPVCRQPCISIFRNFSRDRLNYIKQAEVQNKVNFMKASHLPVLWRDGTVKPFRFNPKAAKEEQAKTYFVQIKAKFLPQRDCFGFSEMLAEPSEKPPKFLKASKADKAEAMKGKKLSGGGKPGGEGKPPVGGKPGGKKKPIGGNRPRSPIKQHEKVK